VVTTTAQQVQKLFDEAVRKVKEAIEGTDALEQEVENLAFHALTEAIKVIVPGLKLVDKTISFTIEGKEGAANKPEHVRGITLPNPHSEDWPPMIISRDGIVYFLTERTTYLYEEGITVFAQSFKHKFLCAMKLSDDRIANAAAVLAVLNGLASIVAEAMSKNEKRNAELENLLGKLKGFPVLEKGQTQ